MSCDRVPLVPAGGRPLGCLGAVNAALAALPAGHPPIVSAAFYYDCPPGADCAVWKFGIVRVTFALSRLPTATVRVELMEDGHVLATVVQ
jgi:hypothetical protein